MNTIWEKYDTDKNGYLDVDEALVFLDDFFKELSICLKECRNDIDDTEITEEDQRNLLEDLNLKTKDQFSKEDFRNLIRDSTGL